MTAIAWCQRTHATPQKGKHAYFTVIYSVLSRPKDVASNHYIELRAIFAGICGVFFASSLPTMAHFWARTDLQIWNSGRPPPPRPPPPNDLCQQLPALLRFPSSYQKPSNTSLSPWNQSPIIIAIIFSYLNHVFIHSGGMNRRFIWMPIVMKPWNVWSGCPWWSINGIGKFEVVTKVGSHLLTIERESGTHWWGWLQGASWGCREMMSTWRIRGFSK